MTGEARTGGPSFHWTIEEDEFLRAVYPLAGTQEIAGILERSIFSVQKRAKHLRLDRPVEQRILTDYERGWLEAFVDGECCIYLGPRKERKSGMSWQARVITGMDKPAMITKAISIVPTRVYLYHPSKLTKQGRRKRVHEIHWFGETLRWLLPQLHLEEKEEQRQLMLEALELLARRKAGEAPSVSQGRLVEINNRFRELNSGKSGRKQTVLA